MYYHKIYEKKPTLQHVKKPYLGCFRILHAHPEAPSVDVYLNDKLIAEDLPYCCYTNYFPLCEGDYKISLCITGSKKPPMVVELLKISEDEIKTLSLVETRYKAGLLTNLDDAMRKDPRMSRVRFIHLSPDAPAVDILLQDGTVLFENVSYLQSTPYISVSPAAYTLHVCATGTPDIVLTIPNATLEQNKYYSINAIGLVNNTPDLEALILPDGHE